MRSRIHGRLLLLVVLLAACAVSCSDDVLSDEPMGGGGSGLDVVFSVAHTDGTTGVAAITYVDHGGENQVSAIATPWQTGTLDVEPGTPVSVTATSQAGDTADLTCTITVDGTDTTANGPGSCTVSVTAERGG
jgi:hypothetical protein